MSISVERPYSITVQWGPVNCIDRNGDITGYIVQYTGGGSVQMISVPGIDTTMTTITSLIPSSTYSIGVAAVNGALIGQYSDPVIVETRPSKY